MGYFRGGVILFIFQLFEHSNIIFSYRIRGIDLDNVPMIDIWYETVPTNLEGDLSSGM